ncbi:hypothetical protein CUZ56_01890 [Saezia sanguinis]|uniref:Knr4/Smi1-like domain-containing protein n=1 Tax=Saezia sanguinis TaxID=1965230 RepID=A0A433SD03_9BURK|nr:hypothetical protein [Saezia sanguinis]RUS66610.1 hypothetical protein CUZ56_01890 [Saezia sanguinis]
MHDTTLNRFKEVAETFNALEIDSRTMSHALLQKDGNCDEPLQEYIRRYAKLAKFGTPTSAQAIEQAQRYAAIAFPAALASFYQQVGAFIGNEHLCDLTIYRIDTVPERARDEWPPYERFYSFGLLDTINLAWGNSRDEFKIGSDTAIVSQQEYDILNQNYMVVGYWAHPPGADASTYIFYDKQGLFGTIYVDQDEFDIFHLLEKSTAAQTWDEVMNYALDEVLKQRFAIPMI